MSIKSILIDALTGNTARISNRGSLSTHTLLPPLPSPGVPNRARYYEALLGTTGADSGTTNANVDGSATTQEFYIESSTDYDLHITEIILLIADSAIVMNRFGNIANVTNGIDLIINESGEDTSVVTAATTNGELLAQTAPVLFGDGTGLNKISNWTGTEDAFLVSIELFKYVPDGLRLGIGNLDRVTLKVNDDLTGLTQFNVRVLGHKVSE